MNDQLLEQLNRRIDDHHDDLCRRIEDLALKLEATHALVAARLEAHEDYHRRNEHRWGLIRLAGRHPFRLAVLAFFLAGALWTDAANLARFRQFVQGWLSFFGLSW